jgi:hypothetical protein
LAVENIKRVQNLTAENNELYQQKLRNFETTNYWFDYLSSAEFKRFSGAVPRQKENKYSASIANSNGTVFEDKPRRKRQVSTTLPLECKNLPAYKNWAEEGKAAPVQNQEACGMINEQKF